MGQRLDRRSLIRAVGVVSVATLAGCLGFGKDSDREDDTGDPVADNDDLADDAQDSDPVDGTDDAGDGYDDNGDGIDGVDDGHDDTDDGLEVGDDGDDTGEGERFRIEPGTTIELEGFLSHWEGLAPEAIEGVENPTIELTPGEEYTMEWVNGDGLTHDLTIWDDDEEIVEDLQTDEIAGVGRGDSLTFEARTEMAAYVCTLHPIMQIGELVVTGE